ncbi:cyclic nucleotide-binding domain-containing protein [Muricauda sp. JGD-17]|uniref:Cyclic nucleotide-binding domain-containing protein n=1 Tax=Flagellimonas ochracea TaxID=2696472 RepID=A0A964T9W8_9FLAO|nr:Crp/Fnr family transcriptional regulator [Allomuricauda ochracea]NAY90904.1 cyclic nucleotide-binding domain-containing protein [Allomuricauda ochracea]
MIRKNPELVAYSEVLFQKGVDGMHEEEFGPRQLILEQDHRYTKIYLIKKGIAKCYILDENGKEFIQEFLGEGMEFGELEIFRNKLTICSVESITSLKVFSFTYSCFNNLLKADFKFNQLIMKALADKIRYKAPRHSYQHAYPIEDNILKLQRMFPEITEVISKKDIANYIGVTPRSLNRALKGLREKKQSS